MRARRTLIATALLFLATALFVPAQAQASDQLSLSWDGQGTYTSEVDGSVFGDVTVVPGDSGSRRVWVRNDGPSEGRLRVQLVDVEPVNATDGFFDDLTLAGKKVSALAGKKTTLLTKTLKQGESTPVDLDYNFPYRATTGNTHQVPRPQVTFRVNLTISQTGEVSSPPDNKQDGGPVDKDPVNNQHEVKPPRPPSVQTGGQVAAEHNSGALLLGLVLGGLALTVFVRKLRPRS